MVWKTLKLSGIQNMALQLIHFVVIILNGFVKIISTKASCRHTFAIYRLATIYFVYFTNYQANLLNKPRLKQTQHNSHMVPHTLRANALLSVTFICQYPHTKDESYVSALFCVVSFICT